MRHGRQKGFTLIELMTVVAVTSILAGLAIGFTGSQRRELYLKEVTRNVVSAITQARAEAIRRSVKTAMSISNTVVQTYIDANGNSRYDSGEKVIFRYPQTGSMNPGYTITSNTVDLTTTNTATLATAIFDYQGYVQDYQGNPVSTVLCVKDTNAGNASVQVRAIQLTAAGSCRVLAGAATATLCP